MDSTGDSHPLLRLGAACAIAVLGISIAVIHALPIVLHANLTALPATLLGGIVPIVIGLGLVVLAWTTFGSDIDDESVAVVAIWIGVGAATIAVVSAFLLVHQWYKGVLDQDAFFLATAATTGGAFVGAVAGRYDVENRRKTAVVESLQQATAALDDATTVEAVCERTVTIANRVLEFHFAGVWLTEPDEHALTPVAIANPGAHNFDSPPTFRPGESLSWEAFEAGKLRVYDDVSSEPGAYNQESSVRGEIVVPLDEYGVLNIGSKTADGFREFDVTVARLLGTATTAALRRAEREEELRENQRELERQNERLEEFTSVVSHDLRNPLTVASGRLELVEERHDVDGQLTAVGDALKRMDELIEDLLALARQGESVGETEMVEIESVARAAWESVPTDHHQFEVADSTTVDADRSRLRQLFENLFRNAVEHGVVDDRTLTVRVGTLGDDLGFFVEDDGEGIPPERRDRIFDVTARSGESGFGLAIVRRIVDAHGWTLEATESDAKGARFEIRFG
ncbi:MAG: ATP-binding protein [Natronomonas sp.]